MGQYQEASEALDQLKRAAEKLERSYLSHYLRHKLRDLVREIEKEIDLNDD